MINTKRETDTELDLRAQAVSAELLSDEPTVQVCLECDGTEEVKNVSAGDESWSVCHSCRSVEGRTEHITESEYEKRQN